MTANRSRRPGILYITTSLAEGGAAKVMTDIARKLRDRYRFSLCCTHAPGVYFEEHRDLWEDAWVIAAKSRWEKAREVRRIVRGGDFALVHSHQEPQAAYGVWGTPWIETVYLLEAWLAGNDGLTRTLACRRAHRFVACANWMGGELVDSLQISPKRVVTILDGVDLDPWLGDTVNGSKQATRRTLGIPEDVTLVGAIGRFARQKGILDFVRAIIQLKAELPEARYVIVGDGEDAAEIHAAIEANDLDSFVLLPGYRRDYREYLRALDIFVFPSRFEGLSLLLLEALASRVPVVATDIPANREAVAHGREALLVPANDPTALAQAVLRLIRDPALGQRLASTARDRVFKHFSLDHMVMGYEKMYRDLIQ